MLMISYSMESALADQSTFVSASGQYTNGYIRASGTSACEKVLGYLAASTRLQDRHEQRTSVRLIHGLVQLLRPQESRELGHAKVLVGRQQSAFDRREQFVTHG